MSSNTLSVASSAIGVHDVRNAFVQLSRDVWDEAKLSSSKEILCRISERTFSVWLNPVPMDAGTKIRLDANWRKLIDLPEGGQIQVDFKADFGAVLPLARVWVEPQTEDDWEIMVNFVRNIPD